MKYPWVLLVALVGFIVAVLIAIAGQKKRRKKLLKAKNYKPIANTARTRNLPEYKSAQRKYRLLLVVLAFLFLIAFGSTAMVAARPVSVTVSKPTYENRDIMLCLDVSGSMDEYNEEILEYFTKLLDEFKGQRVGLTIFNGVPMTLAPLTDDYDMLSELFTDFRENQSAYNTALYYADSTAGQSAIGTGVVGCVNSFDKLGESKRSRIIILATDNEDPRKDPPVTLTQAAAYAKHYGITIYGLATGDWRTQEEIDNYKEGEFEFDRNKEFRESVINTGGSYYGFSKYTEGGVVASNLVDQILAQAAARYEGAETLIKSDIPLVPSIIATVSMVLFVVVLWRLGI